jgi:hypothetical protein
MIRVSENSIAVTTSMAISADMFQDTISGSDVDWSGHGKARYLPDIFVGILDVI